MDRNFFYGTDAAMATGSGNFLSLITGTPSAYGLVVAQVNAYDVVNLTYQDAYNLAITPATRTKGAIKAKNDAKKALKTMAADLAAIIDATPTVTDQQKIDLGLSIRKQPSPVPVPTDRPGVDLVSVVTRTATIHIHDSASSTKRGKPDGTTAAWVYSYVGTSYPTDPTAWDFQGATTRSNHEIVFPDSVANGAQVWICAAWINAKQQAGPVSVPITTNVQGGGVSSATSGMKIAA